MTNEDDIFEAAAALAKAERPAYLDAACANQPEIRARIEALLRSHDATGFMEENAAANSPELQAEWARSHSEQAGQHIGHYKLLEEIGEGGFGVVWVAEQLEPVRRRVALKIIKPGMDSREVIGRFEQERQALAMMDHPNIAKVFDAGATVKGRPYFVMELVRGIRITDYCDKENLPTAGRLKLLITVCHAVQHAHQKGIIHRDLKPSNILVTTGDDGEPVPQVIDFGVAKAIQQQSLTDETIYTQFEQMIGTPAYMSPEQAGLGPMDIDTRSDVYSLGVLLYELLTGRPPFDPKELSRAGLGEMRRVICEVDPPKPSTRISSLTKEELSGTAARRHVEPPKLVSAIRGDLDWIAMKALEKSRSRRYESATGLAADIQRYLANEPVTAAAPGVAYLFRKFARRHQAALGLAALIVVLLVAATGISFWQAKLAFTAKKETADALGEVEKKNIEYRAMLAEAARSDRAVAEEMLRAGREREAFAHLARACEYDRLSTFTAQQAAAALNTWQSPLPAAILAGHDGRVGSAQFSRNGAYIVTASGDKTARVWDAATGRSLVTLAGHEAGVNSAQFSRDGSRIVTVSEDKTARVWDAATGQCLATLAGAVNSAQFNRDGSRIVTGSNDMTARVWDAATGKILVTLPGHENTVRSAQFSPDGSRIITTTVYMTARVWDAATGKILATLAGTVKNAQFSPDGARIVATSDDKTARVLDAATGKFLAALAGHAGVVTSAQFSPDGSRILTASEDMTARVWDVATWKFLGTLVGHAGVVLSAQFSPDGSRILTASEDKTARVWDAATGRFLATLAGHVGVVMNAEFSLDSARIVTASDDKTARVWTAATSQNLTRVMGGGKVAKLSPDGSRILTASEDDSGQVWDVATGTCLARLEKSRDDGFSSYSLFLQSSQFNPNGSGFVTLSEDKSERSEWDAVPVILSAQFSPDGSRVLTTSRDEAARLWDAATGKYLATLAGPVNSAQFSPDGSRILTVLKDKTARLWDAASGKFLTTLAGYDEDFVLSAQFSPDGSRILTASEDNNARVWDAATGNFLAMLAGHAGVVTSAQFSPDNSRILTESEDKTARVWDAATGKCLATLAGHVGVVVSAQFSHRGAYIVTTQMDNTAGVLDAATGKSLATFAGHEDVVVSAQFSSDDTRIVTASRDKTARVWDAATGKSLATLAGHEDVVLSAQFSPDDARIVTASADKTARVWDVATGKSFATLAGHENWVTSAQFCPEGSRILTASLDETVCLWTILPTTVGLPPEWFADFLRYLAQMHLNSDGELEALKLADWLALRERLRALQRASAGQDTPYLRILRRYLPE